MFDSGSVTVLWAVLIYSSVLIGYSSQQANSYFFTNTDSQPKRSEFGSYNQHPLYLGQRDQRPEHYHFQTYQPSSFSVANQPQPFKSTGPGGDDAPFVPHLEVQPLQQPQSQFAQRHPSLDREQFLGQVTLQNPQRTSSIFPFDVPPFKPQVTFASQTERPHETQPLYRQAPVSSRYVSHRARPFSSSDNPDIAQNLNDKDYDYTNDETFNNDYRNRFHPLHSSTEAVPITTHRNTVAYQQTQAFLNNNQMPFTFKSYEDASHQDVGNKVVTPKIAITTHSAYGHVPDDEVTETSNDEDYYDYQNTESEDEHSEHELETEENATKNADKHRSGLRQTTEGNTNKNSDDNQSVHELITEESATTNTEDEDSVYESKTEETVTKNMEVGGSEQKLNTKDVSKNTKDDFKTEENVTNITKDDEKTTENVIDIQATTLEPVASTTEDDSEGKEILTTSTDYADYSDVSEGNEEQTEKVVATSEQNIQELSNSNLQAAEPTTDHKDQKTKHSKSFDVLTMNPVTMVEKDNFKKFVDSGSIDNSEMLAVLDLVDQNDRKTNISEEIRKTASELKSKEESPETKAVNESEPEIKEIVSVVTTKSVINGTISIPVTPATLATEEMEMSEKNHGTESWVVVASVQTSRSVSGARFLPFPSVEQDIRVEKLSDLEAKSIADQSTTTDKEESETTENIETTTAESVEATTEEDRENVVHNATDVERPPLPSTESIIDKLDQLQSELSSGLLTRGFSNINDSFAVLTDMAHMDKETTTTTIATPSISPPPVVIRKFTPYSRPTTTQKSKSNKNIFDSIKMDDLTGLLPAGFKPRNTFKRPITTTTEQPFKFLIPEIKHRNGTTGRSLGQSYQNKITVLDVHTLLPKSKIIPQKNTQQTNKTEESVTEKVDKIASLLTGVKEVDISAFLPPGYKTQNIEEPKNNSDSRDALINKVKFADISSFLPKDFKPSEESTKGPDTTSLFSKITIQDISGLLPKDFNTSKLDVTTEQPPNSSTSGSFKVVFPSRPGGRKPLPGRKTTPKSTVIEAPKSNNGGNAPSIHKGWPVRVTTEFHGWPTPSTTPISFDKLLELQRNKAIAIAGDSFLPPDYAKDDEISSSTTSTSTTTEATTTTTTTTHAPGVCLGECSLAGTIRLIGGAKWVPELLDHNTKEWQLLANEVLTQLDEVYTKSEKLNKWYKKLRIDGFSEGSVLVDYFVELNDLAARLSTLEVKRIFHEALEPVENFTDPVTEATETKEPEHLESLALGKFVVDPKFTDFIVLPKIISPTVGYAEDDMLLPQWAIAVVVIGLASLCFVIIFGVTVLVNRQKNNKKKNKQTPLTEDMLNELNKNHMGGLENYGAEDLYNVNLEENWNNQPYSKQHKRSIDHDNSMSNLYDSWRSQWNRPSPSQYGAGYGADQFHQATASGSGNMSPEAQFYGHQNPYQYQHGVTSMQYQYGHPRRRSDYDTNF